MADIETAIQTASSDRTATNYAVGVLRKSQDQQRLVGQMAVRLVDQSGQTAGPEVVKADGALDATLAQREQDQASHRQGKAAVLRRRVLVEGAGLGQATGCLRQLAQAHLCGAKGGGQIPTVQKRLGRFIQSTGRLLLDAD